MNKNKIKYSIIIPGYNEEEIIETLLLDLNRQIKNLDYKVEIIFADGGSTDNTFIISSKYCDKILKTEKSRGAQLVDGAKLAEGEILFFLHADSKLPPNVFTYLDHNLEQGVVSTFIMNHDSNILLYKLYSFFTKFDSVFTTFGDQGIIIENKLYNKLGGFKKISIMEDVEFLIRARKKSKIRKLNNYLTTSTRKFEKEGIIKNQIKSFILIIKYLLGTDTEKIYKKYYHEPKKQEESSHRIYQISGRGKSKNQISFNNK